MTRSEGRLWAHRLRGDHTCLSVLRQQFVNRTDYCWYVRLSATVFVMEKSYKKIQEWLLDNGYSFKACVGHWKVLRPNGSYLITWPSTPSDVRGARNMIRDLKKAGVEVKL